MNTNTLQTFARETASSHKRVTKHKAGTSFSKLMITNGQMKTLDRYYADIEDNVFEDIGAGSATEWLKDNYYLLKMHRNDLKRQIKNIPSDIPVLSDGIMKGFPRIYAVASAYVDFSAGVLSEENITEFLDAYQSEEILSIDELWSLSSVFSLVLLKNIITLSCRHYASMCERKHIKDIAESAVKHKRMSAMSIHDYCNVNNAVSLAAFIRTLQNRSDSGEALSWLDSELAKLNVDPNEITEFANRIESNCTVTIRNSITSLMKINTFDWEEIFGKVSVADKIMTDDPTGIYPAMDTESKNMYRRKLERYAKKHSQSEAESAEEITEEANEKGIHFGYILFSDKKDKKRLRKIAYVSALYVSVLLFYAFMLKVLLAEGAGIFVFLISAVILFIPVKTTVQQIVNFVTAKLVKPSGFVRMDYENGIPDTCRTVVVVPALLADESSVRAVVKKAEINYLANRSKNISFVILGDYADSDCERMLDDEKIRQKATDEVASLNKKYSERIFFYLQRDRSYNETQNRFFGWERKRGAVIQFNRFLVSGDAWAFSFMSGGAESLVGAKYVITLDADTVLPPGSAFSLVATADHPLNKPVIDEKTCTVISGYGILQPRMETDRESGIKTAFAHIMSGYTGSEPYASTVSEIYQDVFDEGNFGGKGIYSPEVFLKVIDGRFPENAILSHDMIEGSFLRAGYVSDVSLVDEIPSTYISFRKRQHRWMRGDWQLLPYLIPRVKNEKGEKVKNSLSSVSKYKIYENIRRTLFEPMLCLLLLTGVFSKAAFTVFVIIAATYYLFPLAVELIEFIIYRLFGNEYKRIEKESFFRPLTEILLIADTAANSLDAAIRTISRLKKGKNLLEWQTAMQTETENRNSVRYYCEIMRYGVIFGGEILILSALIKNKASFIVGLAFLTAPFIVKRISKQRKKKKAELSLNEEETLLLAARGAWLYYSELCTEETHFLPPDNYQEEPYKGAALRTSPTNIGMMLVGIVAAEKLGFCDKSEVIKLTNKTLRTLSQLEKWNGHPYNWYDIVSLKPLYPSFVSSADNGNLACCLVALREALSEYKVQTEKEVACEEELLITNESISIIKTLLAGMDFSLLYDKKKDLLSVGYSTAEKRLSEYAYDLMASEARLASFYAVISGNVPARHWSRLSRVAVRLNGRNVVKSWSGSMFEYLMPALLLKNYEGSLMNVAFSSMLREQIRYGRKACEPWGISESGFAKFDAEKNYQYKAFGVPCTAVSYIRGNEYVVAPYASALALAVAPSASAQNLIRLKEMKMLSHYGFYEAVDFSGDNVNTVKSYMAHHEGMSLIAVANCLCDSCIVKLFHSAPEVKAGEILLKERVPLVMPYDAMSKKTVQKAPQINIGNGIEEEYDGVTVHPHLTVLSNGVASTVISNSGSNLMMCEEKLVNKRNGNGQGEDNGHFIFIKDKDTGMAYSATPAPLFDNKRPFSVRFRPDSVTFYRKIKSIEMSLRITLCSDKNATVYCLSIKNTSGRSKHFEMADFLLPSLERERDSLQHPQYSDMFVECRFEKERNAVIAERTPHKDNEKGAFAAVILSDDAVNIRPILSRYDFFGRDNILIKADYLKSTFEADKVKNSSLMPMMSLCADAETGAGETLEICYTVAYSDTKDGILSMTDFFSKKENCIREFETAYERSCLNVKYKQLDSKKFALINNLLSRIYYPQLFRKTVSPCRKETLWKYGISGDLPIIAVESERNTALGLKLMLNAYEYISTANIKADLVIITFDDGYHSDNYDNALSAVSLSPCRELLGKQGGIFIIKGENSTEDARAIEKTAVAVVSGNPSEILTSLLYEDKPVKNNSTEFFGKIQKKYDEEKLSIPRLEFFNGYGGFDGEFNEYRIILDKGLKTPHPWCNVMANKTFGTVVTERGGGYSWYKNSRENKLSSWCNDPVSDVPSEAIYVRDDATMQFTSPTDITSEKSEYSVAYSCGKAEYEHNALGLKIKETVFVPESDPVKITILEIANDGDEDRTLSVFYYTECLLSPGVSIIKDDIAVSREKTNGIVYAENKTCPDNGTMFVGCSRQISAVLTKKNDFFGRTGNYSEPAALRQSTFDGNIQKGSADCIVIQVRIEMKAGCKQKAVIVTGGAETKTDATELKKRYARTERAVQLCKSSTAYINEKTHPFRITTNDKTLDALFDSFLMYQTLVCRYYAKTSFYQCSGAFGFRDQLQDALAFVYADEKEARTHILRAAGRQFENGDVRHWWHEDSQNGIRTKISDDKLFLPYVASEYAVITGDKSIFDEEVPFLVDMPIEEEKSVFGKAESSDKTATLYEHCMRAIESVSFGEHGLPLIGSGDWNDGFDKVGEDGRGESVWLAFFMKSVLQKFSDIAERYGDKDKIKELQSIVDKGISESSWDGAWFKRAYYDDGTALGSVTSDECKIDIIAQSWAVLAEAESEDRRSTALSSAYEQLVDEENGIIKLFSPPFKYSKKDPGYIKAYKKGIRENGGQYTHAAIWFAMALLKQGEKDKAYKVIRMLDPVNHSLTKSAAQKYKVEPYVVAADVYTLDGEYGMGGWTWYTGSAAWMYKLILEDFLGIKKEGTTIKLHPNVPESMFPYRVEYYYKVKDTVSVYMIDVLKNGSNVEIDGIVSDGMTIDLIADGNRHKVVLK